MRTKWIYTMFVLALSLFTSCNNEVDEAAGNKKTRTVVFRLSVDDAVGSRATWGDISDNDYNRKDGDGIENRIDLNGLRIAIYSIGTDGKTVDAKVGDADHLLYWPITNDSDKGTDSNDPIEYQLVGDISDVELVDGQDYRFMVYANFPHTTNNQFDLDDIGVTDGYIPMWGVTTYKMKGGDLEDLGTIDLLRAAAKVEVTFADAVTNDYKISGLAIKNYNNTGNNLPTGWDNTASTKALDMEACINATGSHVHDSNLSFLSNVENGKYYIYIPEYRNSSHVTAEQSVVVVTLTDRNNTSKTYEIPFCQYINGSPVANNVHDIVRNHIYQFNVTGVAAGGLLLNFKVADWQDVTSIDLGSLAYPTYLNPVLPSKDHTYPSVNIEQSPTMKYVANGEFVPFEMYFNFISANVSSISEYAWRPTIVDAIATAYSISVYKYDETSLTFGDEPVYVSNVTGDYSSFNKNNYTGWFKIVVTPTGIVTDDTKFTFGISCGVHPSGFPSDDFFLFINGENDQIAWPDSGNDRKFIEITQTVN